MLLAAHGVNAVFSDRDGGVSLPPFDSLNLGYDLGDNPANTQQNVELLLAAAQLPHPHQSQQVHGISSLHCTGEGKFHNVKADILVSDSLDVALAVRTADCLPILLADSQARVLAAVHAGWRGTVAGVVGEAMQAMRKLGAHPQRTVASLGPCIGSCCFEINLDIARQLLDRCGIDVSCVQGDKIFADLALANRLQLQEIGVNSACIESGNGCTSCATQPRYFSHRRDKGQTGRQLSIIAWA